MTAIMLVICMAFDTWTAPVQVRPIIKTLDGSIGQLKQDSVILIEDAKFYDPIAFRKIDKAIQGAEPGFIRK